VPFRQGLERIKVRCRSNIRGQGIIGTYTIDPKLTVLLGNFRFEFEYEIECEFSIPVWRLYIATSHTNLIPEASFFTGKQHKAVRSLETSLVWNSKVVLVLVLVVQSKGRYWLAVGKKCGHLSFNRNCCSQRCDCIFIIVRFTFTLSGFSWTGQWHGLRVRRDQLGRTNSAGAKVGEAN